MLYVYIIIHTQHLSHTTHNHMNIREHLSFIDSRAPDNAPAKIRIAGLTLKSGAGIWNPKNGKSTKMFISLLKKYPIAQDEKVLDLGTGCGILALLVWKKGVSNIYATDITEDAVVNAQENFRQNNAAIKIKQSNVFSEVKGKYDLILFNAPASHPKRVKSKIGKWSLWSDDATLLKKFVDELPRYLTKNGRALVMCSRFADFDPLPEAYLNGSKLTYAYHAQKSGELSKTYIIELRHK